MAWVASYVDDEKEQEGYGVAVVGCCAGDDDDEDGDDGNDEHDYEANVAV